MDIKLQGVALYQRSKKETTVCSEDGLLWMPNSNGYIVPRQDQKRKHGKRNSLCHPRDPHHPRTPNFKREIGLETIFPITNLDIFCIDKQRLRQDIGGVRQAQAEVQRQGDARGLQ